MGITADGSPMVNIFWEKNKTDPDANAGWFWVVCEQTADLGIELNSLLLEHLADPSIVGEEV